MRLFAILFVVMAVTLLGDYYIKLASQKPDGFLSRELALGMLFYGLPGIGWFLLMKSNSLATIAVLYSASMVILLAGLGVIVFREAFGLREAIGVGLALLSIAVMRPQ